MLHAKLWYFGIPDENYKLCLRVGGQLQIQATSFGRFRLLQYILDRLIIARLCVAFNKTKSMCCIALVSLYGTNWLLR